MADNLLKVVADAIPGKHPGTIATGPAGTRRSSSSVDSEHEDALQKRRQVSAACDRCREKKIKCDAARPCAPCTRRGLLCEYETRGGETRGQALKRQHADVSRSLQAYQDVFHLIRTSSDADAREVVRRIRSGQGHEAIVASMKRPAAVSAPSESPQLRNETFLIILAHSTGSLREITALATAKMSAGPTIRLPESRAFWVFRNRTVHFSHLTTLMRPLEAIANRPSISVPSLLNSPEASNPGPSLEAKPAHDPRTVWTTQPASDVRGELVSARSSYGPQPPSDAGSTSSGAAREWLDEDNPPLRVPAAPWTNITQDDEAISHLVSLFFAWINPTWRFVEEDIFLLGMRSQSLESDFCSPFLVNCICAIASLHSEHDVAFPPGDPDRITRGRHFHDEALRLWHLEANRPTLTNVQALSVLSLESNYRAADQLGLQLIPQAVSLDRDVPLRLDQRRCAGQGVSEHDFARVRLATHLTARCTEIIMLLAFMSDAPYERRTLDLLPEILDVFDDTALIWRGYPLNGNAIVHRPTLYLRERCRLASLFREMHDLIFSQSTHGDADANFREMTDAGDRLSMKMNHWYRHLPLELQYGWPMSVAVWELHAGYLAFLMSLLLAIRSRALQPSESEGQDQVGSSFKTANAQFRSQVAEKALATALPLAHRAAQMLCEFRQRYGLKISPAWLLQLQGVTAGVLLLDPVLARGPPTSFGTDELEPEIGDSHTAFDEVFRSLLGTGVEVMIARAIARMMYHTAREQQIPLCPSTQQLLKLMSSTAWRPKDLALVDSRYPNFSRSYEDRERMTELLSRWEQWTV